MGITLGSLRRPLARRSLKAQLNQIRTWVRQGRTDAWIAHQLEVSVGDIRAFKREHDLAPADAAGDGDGEPFGAGADGEEQDLRAEDDALVAAALRRTLSLSTYTSLRRTGTARGASIPILILSPVTASTETSMSSPIMML